MTKNALYTLYCGAIASADRETYIAEWSTSSIFRENANLVEIAEQLGILWDAARKPFREILAGLGWTQAAASNALCTPLRTIENWSSVKHDSDCSPAVRVLLAEQYLSLDISRLFAEE